VEQGADTADATGSKQDNADDLPLSKDELFGVGKPDVAKPGDVAIKGSPPVAIRGFIQNETAYTYADPTHWSRAVVRAQVGASGQLSDNLKWKATVRGDVDPVYIWSNFYNDAVKKDERSSFLIEETFVDTSVAGWDLRLGRQQIIWGEVVGIFVADVVSAKTSSSSSSRSLNTSASRSGRRAASISSATPTWNWFGFPTRPTTTSASRAQISTRCNHPRPRGSPRPSWVKPSPPTRSPTPTTVGA